MKIRKSFKYLPITVMTVGIMLATCSLSLPLLNNTDNFNNQVFNASQQTDGNDYNDQLEYISNDVDKQADVANSIASIKLANSTSGGNYSAALVTKTNGSTLLYMWGANTYGGLGNGTKDDTWIPTKVIINSVSPITQIALGTYHSAALLADGSLYMWGDNEYGELGNGTSGSISNAEYTPILVDITKFGSNKIKQIELGHAISAALLEDGSLYMWGNNQYGQLGNGTMNNASTPILVDITKFGSNKIKQIELGGYHSAVILDNGNLYMWGNNQYGQLGNGTTNNASAPILADITKFGSNKIKQMVLGSSSHSAALLDDGSLYMWGSNDYGQLGNGSTNNAFTPTLVTTLNGRKISQIALGYQHSAALLEDNSIYMWGKNSNGQLGNGTTDNTVIPELVNLANFGSKIIYGIALGANHSCALLEDGSLYMWGRNTWGQLGNKTNIGVVAAEPNPTWMSQLGKDSRITGKSTITAEMAVNNLWVDNKFNLSGFGNSFDLTNIPNVTDQTFAISTKPSYDNIIGTVTMNIKIKYFYDGNGFIVDDTDMNPMTISGFKSALKTNISVKTTPLNTIVVDKWLTYVNIDGKINRDKLEEFLTIIGVPSSAQFIITSLIVNNKTGVLSFNINTDKIMDTNGTIHDTPSSLDPFPITLNLIPRITRMTPITTGYPTNITPANLKTKLFNSAGLVIDQTTLEQYATIKVPVENAKYYLVANSWIANAGDGTASFSVYADKYYDADGNEKTGSSTNTSSQVKITLTLQREASIIVLKSTMPNVRVDRFEAYVKNNGSTVVRSKLEEFFDLTNVPSDAKFTLSTPTYSAYDENFTRNQITFNLAIDKFNQYIPPVPLAYNENFTLTLEPQHMPTRIETNSIGDQDITIGFVENKLRFLVGDDLIAFMKQWVVIESLPAGTTITVGNISANYDTGVLTFDVEPSQIYNASSDISIPPLGTFHLSLTLSAKPAPTTFQMNQKHSKIRIDRFVDSITTLKHQELYDFLMPDYVNFINVDSTKLSVQVISQDFLVGKISIKVSVSQYYDESSNLIQEVKSETFDYVLTPKYTSTAISVLPTSVYPQDLTPDQFKQRLKTDGATVTGENYTLSATNIAFLKKFLKIVSVPPSATYVLTFIPNTYVVTAELTFNLVVSNHYAAGDFIESSQAYNNLTISLLAADMPIKPATVITTKLDAGVVNTADEFLNMITNIDGSYNLEELTNFVVVLSSIPLEGDVITIAKDSVDADGNAHFILHVSYYYDGINPDPQPNGVYYFTVKTKQVIPTVTEEQFPWWWILVGVGGAAGVVGLGVWLFLKKQNGGYRHIHTMKRRYKSRRYR